MYISLHGVFSALDLSLFHLKVLFIGQIWSTTCDCGLFSLLLVSPSLLAVFSHLLSKIFLCLNFSNLIFFLLQPYNFISGLQLHLKVFILKLGQECKLFQLFLMSLQSIRHSRSHMASSKRIIAKHPSKPCFGHQYAAVNRESVLWRHLSRCHIVLWIVSVIWDALAQEIIVCLLVKISLIALAFDFSCAHCFFINLQ